MWQKCPICEGTGRNSAPLSDSSYHICSVCEGRKIINVETGLPPKTNNNEIDTIQDRNGRCYP